MKFNFLSIDGSRKPKPLAIGVSYMKFFIILCLFITQSFGAQSQTEIVKILSRQDSGQNIDKSKNVWSNGWSNRASTSQTVVGYSLVLQLQDGRQVVATCQSKYAAHGDAVNRRSCRVPLVDEVRADFKGDNVKLFWTASIDGSKEQSETYHIVSVAEAKR